MKHNRRRSDKWQLVNSGWLLVITVIVVFALFKQASESDERQGQTCKLFEQAHFNDVSQLKATYAYVQGLSAKEMGEPLNRAVVLQLPDTEKKAKASTPPRFCWSTRVGDPRPLPVVPSRPPGLLPLR